MELDYDILEEIRSYYAGELSAASSQQLEIRLVSDEIYAFHDRLFRASRTGIKKAMDSLEKKWIKDLEEEGLNEEEKAWLHRLKKNDKRSSLLRHFLMVALALLIIVALGFFIWPKRSGITPPDERPILNERPIAGKNTEEGDELLGATGKGILKEAAVMVYSVQGQSFNPNGEKQLLLIQQKHKGEPTYLFRMDTLFLFVENPNALKPAAFQWLVNFSGDSTIYYLSFEEEIFKADPNTKVEMPLEKIKDGDISDLLK